MIVLDASAAIEWLLPSPAGHRIDKRIFSPAQSLHAPHLLAREVAQVMRRYVRDKTMSQQRGEEALEDLRDLSISRYRHDFLLPRVWELRATRTAYDAVYVALAEMLDAPLLACDGGIASVLVTMPPSRWDNWSCEVSGGFKQPCVEAPDSVV